MAQKKYFSAKNREASLLRQRKYRLVRRFGLPEDALGGHLGMVYRRCGKPTCHCASDRGHPVWTLSYSVGGSKRVEFLTDELAAELQPLVEQGRQLREATMDLLAINLRLLRLWRIEQRGRKTAPARPRARGQVRTPRSSRR